MSQPTPNPTPGSDLKAHWGSVMRAVQAACHNNPGYVLLRVAVVVRRDEPVAWTVTPSPVHPVSLSNGTLSPAVLEALGVLLVTPGIDEPA